MKQQNKAVQFIKRNVYYIIMAVCVVAIISMIVLALVLTLPQQSIVDDGFVFNDDANVPAADANDDGQPAADVQAPTETVDKPIEAELPIVFINPVDGSTVVKNYCMTGLVYNNTLHKYEAHDGIDFAAPVGSAVCAVYDGVVEAVNYDVLWGYQVTLAHDNDLRSIYKSLQNVTVSIGDTVVQGEQIGEVSTSAGRESGDGAHLHFSVTDNAVSVDPTDYLVDANK